MFGLRSLHEDDALRAVRAALELREACTALGAELERDHGIRFAVTVGVSTGEVYVGAGARGETFATGDAIKVAARLDEAAEDGEILLGERDAPPGRAARPRRAAGAARSARPRGGGSCVQAPGAALR